MWVVTQTTDSDNIVEYPAVVLGVYRTFGSARARMISMVDVLTSNPADWQVVPATDARFRPDIGDIYYGMDMNHIVRTVLTDGGQICSIQVALLKVEH